MTNGIIMIDFLSINVIAKLLKFLHEIANY